MDERTRRVRTQCHQHARDLIDAAGFMLGDVSYPHIAYHLATLALEEIGKASILTSAAVAKPYREDELTTNWLDSHQRKLQWALWSPLARIDPSDFEEARTLAEDIHRRRLAGLYVDPVGDGDSPAPREQISRSSAEGLVKFAEARLTVAREEGEPTGEQSDELIAFFAIMDDSEDQKIAFSAASRKKYEEAQDAKEWIVWVQKEINRQKAEAQARLDAELARAISETAKGKDRWQVQTVVFTPSHSLRAKVLKEWNNKIKHVQLIWTGKKHELLMQVTLSDAVNLAEVTGRALMLTKMAIAFLNIGSTGYFWFEQPAALRPLFKSIRDLEDPRWKLETKTPLSLWGEEKHYPLTSEHIECALRCMMAFMPMPEEEAAPIFAPYFHGLAMLSKSDVHVSTDSVTHQAFRASLQAAMRKFGDWDSKVETFEKAFHRLFEPIIPDPEHRDIMLSTLRDQPDLGKPLSDDLLSSKRLTDLYLILVAKDRWRDIFEANRTGTL